MNDYVIESEDLDYLLDLRQTLIMRVHDLQTQLRSMKERIQRAKLMARMEADALAILASGTPVVGAVTVDLRKAIERLKSGG